MLLQQWVPHHLIIIVVVVVVVVRLKIERTILLLPRDDINAFFLMNFKHRNCKKVGSYDE